ncbi:MAG: hypothetical protein QGG42_06000 [Phycisphaerae bacterium]|jgi:hypothetical protein|nr:hypothetical protein [Phycisphaerae bacterium]
MKRNVVFGAILITAVAAVGVSHVSADEAVDQLIKQVLGDARSNSDRAAKLYAAGQIAKDTPEIQVVLLSKAIEYGMKSLIAPQARETVQSALALLAQVAPERSAEWRGMDMDLHRRWFRLAKSKDKKTEIATRLIELLTAQGRDCGSKGKWTEAAGAYREAYSTASSLNLSGKHELARALRNAVHCLNVSQKVERYKTALKANPDNVQTRTLLLNALVIDLDAPGRAAEYLNDDVDQAYRTYVPLASKEAGDVQGDVCRELGDWYYKALTPKAAQLSKAAMFVRAQTYYQQFLDAGDAKGVAKLAVKMSLARIDKELEKLASAGMPTPKRDRIIFHAKKSMSPFKAGTRQGKFPVQKGVDCRSPFAGSGIYFDQKTGKEVWYEIFSSSRIKSIYYKGAAIFNTHIQVYSPKGKLLASMGPLKGGNSWYEYTLKLPSGFHNHVFLKFRNDASTWFYINTIKLEK